MVLEINRSMVTVRYTRWLVIVYLLIPTVELQVLIQQLQNMMPMAFPQPAYNNYYPQQSAVQTQPAPKVQNHVFQFAIPTKLLIAEMVIKDVSSTTTPTTTESPVIVMNVAVAVPQVVQSPSSTACPPVQCCVVPEPCCPPQMEC